MTIATPWSIAALVATGLFLTSTVLLFFRGGVLSWLGAGIAVILLVKIVVRPANSDVRTSTLAMFFWGSAWLATWQYVKHTWESGEVVDLSIKTTSGPKVARVWVIDFDGNPTVYYDSPPDTARELMAGTPISMTRGDSTVDGCASAVRVSSLSAETQTAFLTLMNEKYAEQNIATEIFYSVLGGNRNRLPVLVHVSDC